MRGEARLSFAQKRCSLKSLTLTQSPSLPPSPSLSRDSLSLETLSLETLTLESLARDSLKTLSRHFLATLYLSRSHDKLLRFFFFFSFFLSICSNFPGFSWKCLRTASSTDTRRIVKTENFFGSIFFPVACLAAVGKMLRMDLLHADLCARMTDSNSSIN